MKTIDAVSKIDTTNNSVGIEVGEREGSRSRTLPPEWAEKFCSLQTTATLQFLKHVKNCITFAIGTYDSSFLKSYNF